MPYQPLGTDGSLISRFVRPEFILYRISDTFAIIPDIRNLFDNDRRLSYNHHDPCRRP